MNKNLYEQYWDIANVMLVAIDLNGKILNLNKKALDILQYEPHELFGKNWVDIVITPEERARIQEVRSAVASGEDNVHEYVENYVVSKDGTRHLIAWHNAVLRNESGVSIGSLSSGEDITERKATENLLKIKLEELEELNKTMIGREAKMAELKRRIKELEDMCHAKGIQS